MCGELVLIKLFMYMVDGITQKDSVMLSVNQMPRNYDIHNFRGF